MKVTGSHILPLPQERAYQALQDPELLAKCMPGCEGLELIGPNEYKMKMKMALAAFSGLFDGKYYASIQSGFAPGSSAPHPIVISYLTQTGLVPTNAQSLLFKASGSRYMVSLNGQSLSPSPLGGNLYGANVSRFSGTPAELRFTVLTNPPPQPPLNTLLLDSISFSTRVIP